jgi:N-acetylglutamate synthase-like GNAT family acetyltransferase
MIRTSGIRTATAADLPAALELLLDAALPVADLCAERLALVAYQQQEIRGVIGLESLENLGLLRSLVVSRAARGNRVGAALVSALEAQCRERRVQELWLLTIDADAFFEKLGYAVRSRDAAPDTIRGTEEFSVLCPGDAVLMSKEL